ncbi:hypothetical protein SNOG_13775 [Parastagonospora nodorum SN15]|uniref:FAD/NAD(P)-binding domain-containing protein n=1 Tax=Phaeosphaeria nodorum (strain SN15 / ATCC MYA-4574 / FGSC 10173) TaxID=321614 RepID=Q0U389_PHANO|nr:hypothetical protein SNOG_13775 [Parastagonospora nodorum SN15]EAT78799.2 hypothetical protein SNOG_13775 [Parastagonospora nodorum SN15]
MGCTKYIRFNTSVEEAHWDDEKRRWKVDVKVTGGKDAEFNPQYSIDCDFLVSAVGQLNQPRFPDIEGLEDFQGKIMHSARWDWSHSLEGKKVGIIGNDGEENGLWEKLTPDYNPGCKRVIISDDYYPAVADPKTTLETNKIARITPTGIQLENGTTYEHDIIVLATGFRTVEFMYPIKITGTGGRSLEQIWEKGASALYGTTVPSLPNFGMFYGPNTNLGHNSIILMIEAQSRYLNTLVSAVLDARNRGQRIGLTPRSDRTDAFNQQIQEILQNSSFADPKCGSWYKNKDGKITNNWSGTVVEYQEMLSKVDWEDFETTVGEREGERARDEDWEGAGGDGGEQHGVGAGDVECGCGGRGVGV